jgi:hypothetical protein
MSPLIQSEGLKEDHAVESRGQRDILHAIWAKQHLKNKWGRESYSDLHRGQRESAAEIGKMVFSLDFIGRMSQAIFQSNNLSLAFRLIFHRRHHCLGFKGEESKGGFRDLMSL